ncbi:MAG: response regulator [Gemmataceae bacterium]|nr:response regulator [Gemmataceae bacterium]
MLAATPPPAPLVLIVDDSPVDRLVTGRLLAKAGGWRVAHAGDGEEALAAIGREVPAAVLTDLQMPRMDGLALVERVREDYPKVPVVLMTGNGSEEIALAAMRAGAASYVPKRSLATELVATLERVLAASRTDGQRARVLGCLAGRVSRFVLENDPGLVQPLLAMLREDLLAVGVCDQTEATRVGIALEEALLNAIYHGNLGVSSNLKQEGDGSAFYQLADERRGLAPYCDRRVRVGVRVTAAAAAFVVADDGPGFDVSALPDPTDPENLIRPSGRGILFMRMFMDDVRYSPKGNRVTLVKRRAVPEAEAAREAVPEAVAA